MTPTPPPGFVLDGQPIPTPPPGFVLDSEPAETTQSNSSGNALLDTANEFASGVNRTVIDGIEFFTVDQVNSLLSLVGSDKRIPSLKENGFIDNATKGGQLGDGLTGELVGKAGEVAGFAAGTGAALRGTVNALPKMSPSAGTGRRMVEELGKTTAGQDITAGALAGAGQAIGEDVGGPVGGVVGAIALPLGAIGAANTAGNAARGARALKSAQPTNEIVKAGQEAGVPVLTSDLRQPSTFAGKTIQKTTEKIPIAGTGGIRRDQQAIRQKAVDDIANKYGEFSYENIITSLKTQSSRVKNAAGRVLENTGKKLDATGEVPLSNTRAAITEVQAELSKPGIIQSGSAVDDLQKLTTTINEAPQTFTSLKQNRTAFREIVSGADKAERSQLTSRAKALLERVHRAMTTDMESFAKQNLEKADFVKWKRANAVYANEATKLTKSRLKNVLDKGDVTPEAVKQMLFSQSPSDIATLHGSLTTSGRANARAAIISKVVTDLSKRQSGLNPNAFASEIGKYPAQVNVFFRGREKQQLEGLVRVLNATRRAQDASVSTATGQELFGIMTGASLAIDSGLTVTTGGTLGALARLYESAPVRNALLRLAAAPKGTGRYEQALTRAHRALTAAALAMRNESQGKEKPQ